VISSLASASPRKQTRQIRLFPRYKLSVYTSKDRVFFRKSTPKNPEVPVPLKPYIDLNEVEAVLAGKADRETTENLFNGFYHRLLVYLRGGQGTQPQELESLYRHYLENMEKAGDHDSRADLLKNILKDMKKDYPRELSTFIFFKDLSELSRFLQIDIPPEKLSPQKVLFVGGIHGNEISGIKNAKALQQKYAGRKDIEVIPEANTEACRAGARRLSDGDLNRMFPGNAQGTPLEKRAHQIYRQAKNCDLIIDFHESKAHWSEGGLGKLCIFHPGANTLKALKPLEKVLIQEGFRFDANPFRGELIREISENDNRAAFLIELPRTMSLEERVKLADKLSRAFLSAHDIPLENPPQKFNPSEFQIAGWQLGKVTA